MIIWMTGVDHKTADLDIRSKFSFISKKMKQALEFFMGQASVRGCIILSTCNRTEIWLSVTHKADFSLQGLLCDVFEMNAEIYRTFFTERKKEAAVDHLFRLASGLESRIIGEEQILTQVGNALAFARSCYAADHVLEVLFRHAVTAGKRVRTETDFSVADRSVIHTALGQLALKGISVKGKNCLVIGNGMMGRLSAQTLLDSGAKVTSTVRQYHSGVVDIPQGCERINYADRYRLLPACDLVISATSSPNYTLTFSELKEMHPGHIVPLLDLAVPRDIEPEVAELPWTDLYDIDSFSIDLASEKFRQNLQKAETIIREEKNRFYEWYEGRDYVQRIGMVKLHAGQDVASRLMPVFKQLPMEAGAKKELQKEIEGASARMMNHLLYQMRAKLSEQSFQEMLDAMTGVLQKD